MEVSYRPTCISLEAHVGEFTEFDYKSHTILADCNPESDQEII